MKCKICGGLLPGGQRKYCCQEGAREGQKLRRRAKPAGRRKCRRCRSWFHPFRRGHVVCSAACRQAEVRERATRRDIARLVPRLALHRDLQAMGLVSSLTKESRLDLAAVERA